MAVFVAQFGWTPADYYRMTLEEREAIVRELNRRAAEAKKQH